MNDNDLVQLVRLDRRSAAHRRMTCDILPLNMEPLTAIVVARETDKNVKAVAFENAVESFFLPHDDFLASRKHTPSLPSNAEIQPAWGAFDLARPGKGFHR